MSAPKNSLECTLTHRQHMGVRDTFAALTMLADNGWPGSMSLRKTAKSRKGKTSEDFTKSNGGNKKLQNKLAKRQSGYNQILAAKPKYPDAYTKPGSMNPHKQG